ncbi:dentin sialophosphoprotein-like [Osmerus mordax]|uniref:dentin sialophosphoprotein-like n=1 Tax=Osmerus mordax TaxID=8014 RepID=UPI003510BD37
MVVAFAICLRFFSVGCLLVGAAVCAPVLQGDSGNSMGNIFPGSSPRLAPQKQTEKPTNNMVTQKPPNPRGLKHGNGIFGLARNSKSPYLSNKNMKPSSSSGNAFLLHKRAKIPQAGQSILTELNAEVDNCDSGDATGCGGNCIHPSGCYAAPDDSGGVSCSDSAGCGTDMDAESGGVSFESGDPSSCGKDTGGTSNESDGAVSFESGDPSSCGKDTDGTSTDNESAGTDSGSREYHPDSGAEASQETTGLRKRPFSNVRSKYHRRKFVFSQMRYTPGEFKTHRGHNPFLVYWSH